MDEDDPKSPPPEYEEVQVQSPTNVPNPRPTSRKHEAGIFSTRNGEHWMDGYAILATKSSTFLRPWDDCIPLDKLSRDNLPPFYVRLRDDQVGSLWRWVQHKRSKKFPLSRLGQYWPADFTSRDINNTRKSWGPAFDGQPNEGREDSLVGGDGSPTYVDQGLPPTYTSSLKIMRQKPWTSQASKSKKRRGSEMKDEAGGIDGNKNESNVDEPTKKTRHEDDHSRDAVVRLLIAKIDTMTAEATQMQKNAKTLETTIVDMEAQFKPLTEQKSQLTTKCEILKDRSERLEEKLITAKEQLRVAEVNLEEQERFIARLQANRVKCSQLAALKTSFKSAQEALASFESEIKRASGDDDNNVKAEVASRRDTHGGSKSGEGMDDNDGKDYNFDLVKETGKKGLESQNLFEIDETKGKHETGNDDDDGTNLSFEKNDERKDIDSGSEEYPMVAVVVGMGGDLAGGGSPDELSLL